MRRVFVSQRVEMITEYGERRDALDQRWAVFLGKTGALTLPVPNNPELVRELMREAPPEGILLTGGNSPVNYGGDAPERDAADTLLLEYSVRHEIPLIGVCRGMQSIFLHFGGRLQVIDAHVAVRHRIDGKISRSVNSYHGLAAFDAPSCLEVLATGEDGVIEAVRHKALPILAIMWHPEREAEFSAEDVIMFTRHWNGRDIL